MPKKLPVGPAVIAVRRAAGEATADDLGKIGVIELLDPRPLLCDDLCGVMRDRSSMYLDIHHLTNASAPLPREACP